MSVTAVQEQTIDVEGLRTRYLTAGDDGGPPLVLLHGVGTSAGEWSWVLPNLAHAVRSYLPLFTRVRGRIVLRSSQEALDI